MTLLATLMISRSLLLLLKMLLRTGGAASADAAANMLQKIVGLSLELPDAAQLSTLTLSEQCT
jgi:hypothetical protein